MYLSGLIAKTNTYILGYLEFVGSMLILCLVMAIMDSPMGLVILPLYFLASATTSRDSVNDYSRL